MSKIQRALVSVSDKTGLVEFVRELRALGIEIISTGGTARSLREAGIPVIEISDYTGFPEMMDGRVKTLHPKVHGGLLYIRGNPEHEAAAAAHGIKPIDLVAVNLYPFEQSASIENIDIGGLSMLRSAAKNHTSVTVVVDPAIILTCCAISRNTAPTPVRCSAGNWRSKPSTQQPGTIPRLLATCTRNE